MSVGYHILSGICNFLRIAYGGNSAFFCFHKTLCALPSMHFQLSLYGVFLFSVLAIVGDITPSDGIPKSEKSRREREALNHMYNLLGGGARGNLSHFSPVDSSSHLYILIL